MISIIKQCKLLKNYVELIIKVNWFEASLSVLDLNNTVLPVF